MFGKLFKLAMLGWIASRWLRARSKTAAPGASYPQR